MAGILNLNQLRQYTRNDIDRLKQRALNWYETKPKLWGLPTGIERLDNATGGLSSGEIVVLAGGPGSGKTTFAMQALETASEHVQREGLDLLNVLISAEMSRTAVLMRSACRRAGIDSQELRRGNITEEGLDLFQACLEELYALPLLVVDGNQMTSGHIASLAESLANEGQRIGTIAVDYIQQLWDEGGGGNETSRINLIMRNLSSLKLTYDCNLLLLSQYSRGKLKEGRPPTLEDLLGSGNIERAADQVWALHDPKTAEHEEQPQLIRKELHVLKNRNGKTGRVHLDYYPAYTLFTAPGEGPTIMAQSA